MALEESALTAAHSHTTITENPSARSSRATRASRFRLLANLSSQNARFRLGMVALLQSVW